MPFPTSTLAVLLLALLGTAHIVADGRAAAPSGPFARFARFASPRGVFHVKASRNAFGLSQEVTLRMALPGDSLEFPLEVSGDPSKLTYRWVAVGPARNAPADSVASVPLAGAFVVVPSRPGLYQIALTNDGVERVLEAPLLAVAVPFESKVGGVLNGYRIGTYLAERWVRGAEEHPEGFIEVTEAMVDLPVSRHLRFRDFITHDMQDNVWPKYVALDVRLLDKVELVLAHLAARGGDTSRGGGLALDVHSGVRTPAYNAKVRRAAQDSRHQYGDAADLAIDADRDGRITVKDEVLVAVAVDQIEALHPDLVGGLGLYTSRRYRTPYVHIDVRGKRSRWKG
jgi:uncharacterized protein YcbK (DUF882 family)